MTNGQHEYAEYSSKCVEMKGKRAVQLFVTIEAVPNAGASLT